MHREQSDSVSEILAAWGREMPDVDASSIAVLTPLIRVAAQVHAVRNTTLREFGIDQGRLSILGALRRSGPPYRLSAGELAARCRVTAGAITQRLDRLEVAGHVVRHRNPADGRGVTVELTDSGRGALDVIFRAVIRADEQVLACLTPQERAVLAEILGSWMKAAELDHTAPDPSAPGARP